MLTSFGRLVALLSVLSLSPGLASADALSHSIWVSGIRNEGILDGNATAQVCRRLERMGEQIEPSLVSLDALDRKCGERRQEGCLSAFAASKKVDWLMWGDIKSNSNVHYINLWLYSPAAPTQGVQGDCESCDTQTVLAKLADLAGNLIEKMPVQMEPMEVPTGTIDRNAFLSSTLPNNAGLRARESRWSVARKAGVGVLAGLTAASLITAAALTSMHGRAVGRADCGISESEWSSCYLLYNTLSIAAPLWAVTGLAGTGTALLLALPAGR